MSEPASAGQERCWGGGHSKRVRLHTPKSRVHPVTTPAPAAEGGTGQGSQEAKGARSLSPPDTRGRFSRCSASPLGLPFCRQGHLERPACLTQPALHTLHRPLTHRGGSWLHSVQTRGPCLPLGGTPAVWACLATTGFPSANSTCPACKVPTALPQPCS